MIRNLYQSFVEAIFGQGLFEGVVEILSSNPSTGEFAGVWQVISTVYEYICVPLGMGLVLIYFMINVIERSMHQQQFDMEQMVKMLLKLVFGMYFIQHGLDLMASIYSLGISFLNGIINGGDAVGFLCNNCGQILEEMFAECPLCHIGVVNEPVHSTLSVSEQIVQGAWAALTGEEWEGNWGPLDTLNQLPGLTIAILLPGLGAILIKLVASAVCFFRLIEFYLQTCMAPIALADFFTEGTHGNGWRFVKNYIALALQMGIILLAIVAFNAISVAYLPNTAFWQVAEHAGANLGAGPVVDIIANAVSFVNDLFDIPHSLYSQTEMYREFCWKYLALGFSCTAILLKSRSLAKEIVGVH